MARKKVEPDPNPKPIGPILARNLERLGYVDKVIRVGEIAEKVRAKSSKGFSRQRMSQILNAVRVENETLELIAKGLGVKVADLTRDD